MFGKMAWHLNRATIRPISPDHQLQHYQRATQLFRTTDHQLIGFQNQMVLAKFVRQVAELEGRRTQQIIASHPSPLYLSILSPLLQLSNWQKQAIANLIHLDPYSEIQFSSPFAVG